MEIIKERITYYTEDGELLQKEINGDLVTFANISGKFHRTDGPAVVINNFSEEWYINGFLHREDGPAYITKHSFGISHRFFLFGKELTKDGWEQQVTEIKLKRLIEL
jgi:hypothetical protein